MSKGFRLAAAVVLTMAAAHQAYASGYEKTIMWGGRSAALGGVATPWISGSQSIYFNPAGLVGEAGAQDVGFAISPTAAQFSGPITNDNSEQTSSRQIVTPLGLTYAKTINDQWGFGIGYYVSGGSKVAYDQVDFGGTLGRADIGTNLTITEVAVGAGYKVNDALKVGAALRHTMAEGSFAFAQRVGAANLLNLKLTDLKDSSPGYKLGAQYKVSDATSIGAMYRSTVGFEAAGRIGGTTTIGTGTVTPADASAATVFPQQFSLGMIHLCNEQWTALAEYQWTQYSQVQDISVTTTTTAGGAIPVSNPQVTQNWKDQHSVRLASEYTGMAMPLRFGYGFTSQVTDKDFARASFTAPGPAHTVTVGSGNKIAIGENAMNVDYGYEYTTVTGEGNGTAAGTGGTGTDVRAGTYKTSAHALHLSAVYNF